MHRSLRLPILALLGALSCREAEAPAPAEGPHPHPHEDPAHPEDDVELVRVERGMLRDLRVTTQPAESRPAGEAAAVLGELRVNEDAYAEIGTPIAARVARVMAAPGDRVAAGQPLVELESAEVGRGRAALLTARARRDLANQTVERVRPLGAEQIVARREVQAAEAELIHAEAEARAAEESLAALGATTGSGSRFILSSPIAGTVIDRVALRGRMVDPEHPLYVVGDLSRLWLVVHAFERDALRMRPGTPARVVFPALPAQPFTGTLTHIGSKVDPASRSVDVRVELDNPQRVLRPGMSATALLALGDSDEVVVAVPVEAVQRRPQGWCVFIPRAQEGEFELRPVGRGRDLEGEVEILSGLRAGEVVVVDGAFLLKAEADKARAGGEAEHHH